MRVIAAVSALLLAGCQVQEEATDPPPTASIPVMAPPAPPGVVRVTDFPPVMQVCHALHIGVTMDPLPEVVADMRERCAWSASQYRSGDCYEYALAGVALADKPTDDFALNYADVTMRRCAF